METLEWSISTPYSIAMGHNIQTTSLQMARAYAVFANGGFLVRPTLIKKIVRTNSDGSQDVIFEKSKQLFPRTMDAEIVQKVAASLKYTTKLGGTGRRGDVWGYSESGKSGTAQKIVEGQYSKTLFCSSFIGIVPANHPSFVIIVTMDEPEYGFAPGIGKIHMGGVCSAPVFREIAKRSLEYLGIEPDDPHGYPVGDPRYDPEKADWVKETRRLQEIYEKWNNITEGKNNTNTRT